MAQTFYSGMQCPCRARGLLIEPACCASVSGDIPELEHPIHCKICDEDEITTLLLARPTLRQAAPRCRYGLLPFFTILFFYFSLGAPTFVPSSNVRVSFLIGWPAGSLLFRSAPPMPLAGYNDLQ